MITPHPSPQQIELLHHTLGLSPRCREPYRNHFVAGPGHHAQADLLELVRLGLMERARAPSLDIALFREIERLRRLAERVNPLEPENDEV